MDCHIDYKNMFSLLSVEKDLDNIIEIPLLSLTDDDVILPQVRKCARAIDSSLFLCDTIPIVQKKDINKDILYNKPNQSQKPPHKPPHKQTYKTLDINYQCTLDTTPDSSAKMENKKWSVSSLGFTKACHHVTQKTDNGSFGTCYRENCSFAHSLSEWKPPNCMFNSSCRYPKDCKFLHSFESIEEWKKRTSHTSPDLPLTNEESRKPTKTVEKPTPSIQLATQVSSKPTKTVDIQLTNHWKPKLTNKTLEQHSSDILEKTQIKPILTNTDDKNNMLSTKLGRYLEYSKDYMFESDNDCDMYKSLPSTKSFYIIRAPNTEIAEIAIKAFIDKGITNIQVELV